MWIYWCLLSTVISGFTAIAIKKCSDNDPKRMAIMGLLSYHTIMVVVSLSYQPNLLTQLNLMDMVKMLPGILLQSMGFFCAISSIKYGKVGITSSIKKVRIVVTFLLGIILLKENCTVLQVMISTILVVLAILIAKEKTSSKVSNLEKKAETKAILFSYGFVIFNGTSNFLNKVYVNYFENPMYVLFNYAIIILIGILLYCIITKKWEYIDIRKMNHKGYFILQSLLDSSSSIFNRFALVEGNVSVISVIESSSIVITILASRWILKEKVTWKKYLMMIGIFLCVMILAMLK